MAKILKGNNKKLLELGIIGSFAGVFYQFVTQSMVDFGSVMVGFPLGFCFGYLELFALRKYNLRFQKISFWLVILIKSSIYTISIFILTLSLSFVWGGLLGKEISEFKEVSFSMEHIGLVVYTLVFYALLLLYLQINRLLGPGIFFKFLQGKYRKPKEEERIFMFLDLKSSTTIAENLGNQNYYAFLNDFFNLFTGPVLATKAEIYQYVGDEVVFTWPTNRGIENSNCIQIFYAIKEKIKRAEKHFIQKYKYIPEFKAGLHCGKVISAQIGDIKREIVYNGDVLNTTSRIQGLCNKYNCELLLSGKLNSMLNLGARYSLTKIGDTVIEGKREHIDLYGIKLLKVDPIKSFV